MSDAIEEGAIAPAGGSQPDGAAGGSPASLARPEWLSDDRYWNAEKGSLEAEKLYGSYRELQGAFGRRVSELGPASIKALVEHIPDEMRTAWTEETKTKLATDAEWLKPLIEAQLPKPPEAYEIAPDVKAPVDKDSELYKEFTDFAKQSGLPNEAFNKLLQFAEKIAPPVMTDDERQAELDTRLKALGPNPGDRIKSVVQAARNALAPDLRDGINDFMGAIVDPRAFMALEALVKASGERQPPTGAGAPAVDSVTQESLDAMTRDPRYWRERDPAFVARVTAGFQKLYGGETI